MCVCVCVVLGDRVVPTVRVLEPLGVSLNPVSATRLTKGLVPMDPSVACAGRPLPYRPATPSLLRLGPVWKPLPVSCPGLSAEALPLGIGVSEQGGMGTLYMVGAG